MKNVSKEMAYLFCILLLFIAILKIVYFNSSIWLLIKVAVTLFIFYILPGFMLMYYFDLLFMERLFISFAVSISLLTLVGYYAGIIGFHIKYMWIFSIICVSLGIWFTKR